MITPFLAQAFDPDAARREAQRILSDRRYHANPAPRPLRGPLQWLTDRLHGVFDWFARVFDAVPAGFWIALGVALAAVLIAIVFATVRRRVRVGADPSTGVGAVAGEPEDADALDRAADDAERDGDLERAVRLRFRAGLLRLGTHGAITYRPSVTTGEVRASLGSETFDELAGTFERVAYGGREAGQPDVDAARREWPHVLQEASVREPGIPASSEPWPERPVAEGDKSGKQEADRR